MREEFRLEEIELYNMFNYRKSNVIDFKTTRPGNVYLFDLFNGAGKTNLFLSVKWGFYGFKPGVTYVKSGKNLKMPDFINKYEKDGEGCFHVTINFRFKGEYIELCRECKNYKIGTERLTIRKSGREYKDVEAEELIDSIIPQDCGDFFMFNGEILEEIANMQKDYKRSEGVVRMLGLKKLDDLVKELKVIKERMSAEVSKSSGSPLELKNLYFNLTNVNDEIHRMDDEKKAIDTDLVAKKEQYNQLISDRNKYANVDSTVKELDRAGIKKNSLTRDIDQLKTNIQEDSDKAYLLFLNDDIRRIISKNEEKQSQLRHDSILIDTSANHYGTIQMRILKSHLEKCPVCGAAISDELMEELEKAIARRENSIKEYDKFESLRKNLETSNGVFKSYLKQIPSKLQDDCASLLKKTQELIKLNLEIDHLHSIVMDSDVTEIKTIDNNIVNLENAIHELNRKSNKLEIKLKDDRKIVNKIERKISEASQAESEGSTINNRFNFLCRFINRLEDTISSITRSKRGDILRDANEIFMDLTNKKDTYKGLEFDNPKAFSMHIVQKDGSIVENKSSGEEHIVAFSFLFSLSKNTEHLNPLVIDTPLSRLDLEHKKNIGTMLGKLENQVIFLAQSGELDTDTKMYYRPHAAKMYTAIHTEDNSACIQEVDF